MEKWNIKTSYSKENYSSLNTKEITHNTSFNNITKEEINRKRHFTNKISLRKKAFPAFPFLITSPNNTSHLTSTRKKTAPSVHIQKQKRNKTPSKPFYLIKQQLTEKITFFHKETQKHKIPHLSHIIKTPKGNYLKAMSSSSILINTSINKSTVLQRLLGVESNKIFSELKSAIRWLCIGNLWKEYLLILDKVYRYYSQFKFYLENKEQDIVDKKSFYDYLHMINTKNLYTENKNAVFDFCDEVYLIFSFDKKIPINIDIKEFLHCMIVTNLSMSYENKIELLCQIWSKYDNDTKTFDYIYLREICRLIRVNLYYQKDYEKIHPCIKEMFDNEEKVTKEKVYELFINNIQLRRVMNRNLYLNYQKIEDYFNEEILKIFHANLANSRNLINGRMLQTFCANDADRLKDILHSLYQSDNKKHQISNLKYMLNQH